MRSSGSFLRCRSPQTAVLTSVILLAVATANAYTIVLRNGRVVEVPKTFSVSASTITYEVSPGFQVTLQRAAIDIAATDRANREPSGSFLSLLKANQTQRPRFSTSTTNTRRQITNKDLESFASARIESERLDELRRKELGLPSKEELRRQAAAESETQRKKLEQTLSDQAASEAYWRERATNLRAEIAAADAEITAVRQQLDWLPQPNTLSAFTIGTGFAPIVPFGIVSQSIVNPVLQAPISRPQVFIAPQRGPVSRINVGPIIQHNRPFHNRFPGSAFGVHRQFGNQFPFFSNFGTVGYQPYDLSYEWSSLRMRLNELVTQRAGLHARWRVLEDEARRAGAYPGWLRP